MHTRRTWRRTLVAAIVVTAVAGGIASASMPSALEMADRGLVTVVGPDNEGSYALIDPIGPGGVRSIEAADEVYASTLQGGVYHPWEAYRDPFAPQPAGPPDGGPYKPHWTPNYDGGRAR